MHYHGWIRALNDAGAPVWARRIDGGREIHVQAIAAAGDDFVVAGEQRAGDARAYTAWVARYDAQGTQRWRVENLGEAGVTSLHAIAVSTDGTVIAGGTRSWKSWLVAFTPEGVQRWQQQVADVDDIKALTRLGDTIVGCGVVGRKTTQLGTSRLFAVNAAGEQHWSTPLLAGGGGELLAIAAGDDGGIAVGTLAVSHAQDAPWIVRFAADGDIRESRVLDSHGDASARAVAIASDGSFVIAGTVSESLGASRLVAWRFDRAGGLRWQRSFASETLAPSIVAVDDGVVVAGSLRLPGTPLRSWIFAIDPQGAVRWTVP